MKNAAMIKGMFLELVSIRIITDGFTMDISPDLLNKSTTGLLVMQAICDEKLRCNVFI